MLRAITIAVENVINVIIYSWNWKRPINYNYNI
jgi:hypothetical protein